MHATIRQYEVSGDPHAVSQTIQDTFIPQLKGLPGYVSYMWIDPSTEGGRPRLGAQRLQLAKNWGWATGISTCISSAPWKRPLKLLITA